MNFTEITTYDQCLELYQSGQLDKRHLIPERFGGPDEQHNQLFMPLGSGDALDAINNGAVAELLAGKTSGQYVHYNVSPNYKGDSYIPGSFTLTAHLVDEATEEPVPGGINTTVELW